MTNKRKVKRRNSPHRINVLAAPDDHVIGRLVDITTSGLMFLTSADVEPGTRLQLRLPLPTRSTNRNSIEVEADVVWSNQDSNPRFMRVGVQFVQLGAEEGYIIETVLQKLHLVG